MNPTELAYRTTAVEGSGGFGLLIALYDTLAGDLRRAAEAQRNNDIEKRCQEVNHALLVISHLDDWVDREGGGELAMKLVGLYTGMRKKLFDAQLNQSAEMLHQQMEMVIAIRGTWQQLEARASSVLDRPAEPETSNFSGPMPIPQQQEQSMSSWSA